MFLGQPRVEATVSGQRREAELIVEDNPPDLILDLQTFLKGARTLAHSSSQLVGRPSLHADAAFVQQAALIRSSPVA